MIKLTIDKITSYIGYSDMLVVNIVTCTKLFNCTPGSLT